MNLYFAPLEGITGYIYRNAHAEMFGGCDAYYAPFITPVENERLSIKCMRDIEPHRNKVNLKIQVLTSKAEAFGRFENEVRIMGYSEVNLNFGCPSGTVVKKGRGAGALREPCELDGFLKQIYEFTSLSVSVKTRAGFYDPSEMDTLMDIYNRYHLTSLIIHPRTREDYYKGAPRMDVFKKAYDISVNNVCYNGNVFSAEDYRRISQEFPRLEGVMIGRGAVANPAIFREIRGGDLLKTQEILDFSDLLCERYMEVLRSDAYTLHKLKEIWIYMMNNYPQEKKILKEIKKSNSVRELRNAVYKLSTI